jgi:hypothetical protein
MNINAFFNTLAANPSRNFKIEELEKHVDNETLREVIRLTLCPFTQFYQRKIPAYTCDGTNANIESILPALYDLSSRQVTGNAAIEYLRMLLSSLNPDDAKVLERIIDKSLDCGVQVSTANAVWSGLIKEYPVMLCSQFEQKLVDKIKFPAYVQLKMDGMRFNAIVRDGKCEFRSRNGKEIQLLGISRKNLLLLLEMLIAYSMVSYWLCFQVIASSQIVRQAMAFSTKQTKVQSLPMKLQWFMPLCGM